MLGEARRQPHHSRFLKIEFECGENLLQGGIDMGLVVLHSRMRSASCQRNSSSSPAPHTAASSLRSSCLCPCLTCGSKAERPETLTRGFLVDHSAANCVRLRCLGVDDPMMPTSPPLMAGLPSEEGSTDDRLIQDRLHNGTN